MDFDFACQGLTLRETSGWEMIANVRLLLISLIKLFSDKFFSPNMYAVITQK